MEGAFTVAQPFLAGTLLPLPARYLGRWSGGKDRATDNL